MDVKVLHPIHFGTQLNNALGVLRGEGCVDKVDTNKVEPPMMFKICWLPREGNVQCDLERFPLKC